MKIQLNDKNMNKQARGIIQDYLIDFEKKFPDEEGKITISPTSKNKNEFKAVIKTRYNGKTVISCGSGSDPLKALRKATGGTFSQIETIKGKDLNRRQDIELLSA